MKSLFTDYEPVNILKPSSAAEVQEIIRKANKDKTPLVPVSSGTNMQDTHLPSVKNAVAVDLSGLKGFYYDDLNRNVIVEPGVTFADLEKAVRDFGRKANDGSLSYEDLTGGTFTISNGGVYGSMLSTPILNPPQTAILGMHNIKQRPVVVDGEIVIRPMMYLALSYDHRIIDGKEAVSILVTIKNMLEDPTRLLLQI